MNESNSQHHLSSIPKFRTTNLYGGDFVWKPTANWKQSDLQYTFNKRQLRQDSVMAQPFTKSAKKNRSQNISVFRHVFSQHEWPLGQTNLQLFEENFTQGFLFSNFEHEVDNKMQLKAISYLISAIFYLTRCDFLRIPEDSKANGLLRKGPKTANIISFITKEINIRPVLTRFVEISKQEWMSEGPGKQHQTSLLYLAEN